MAAHGHHLLLIIKENTMKKYIRLQEVMAEPMTLKEYEKKTGKNPLKDSIGDSDYPGYMILNNTGFGHWVKKEVFEAQYISHETRTDRMMFEFGELAERIDKLEAFLQVEDSKKLSMEEKTLLMAQYHAMSLYAITLTQRIDNSKKK